MTSFEITLSHVQTTLK